MLLYICLLCAATTPAAPGRESFPPTCAGHSCSEDQQQLTVIQCGQRYKYKLVYISPEWQGITQSIIFGLGRHGPKVS